MFTDIETFRTVEGALNKAHYIGDAQDPNHVRKEVQAEWFGCAGELEFALELEAAQQGDGKIRRGPKVKVLAYEFVVRTPYQANLTRDEFRLIVRAIIEEMDIRKGRLGVHLGTQEEIGCLDSHLITLNRDSFGRPLSAKHRSKLYLRFRKLMDRVHDQINDRRRAIRAPEIPTMKTIHALMRDVGRANLVEKLAASDIALDTDSIVLFLKGRGMLGRRLRTNGDEKDYVSVVYPKRDDGKSKQPNGRSRRPSGQREMILPFIRDVQDLRRLKASTTHQPIQDDQVTGLTPKQRKALVHKIREDMNRERASERKRQSKKI